MAQCCIGSYSKAHNYRLPIFRFGWKGESCYFAERGCKNTTTAKCLQGSPPFYYREAKLQTTTWAGVLAQGKEAKGYAGKTALHHNDYNDDDLKENIKAKSLWPETVP